ncbi:carbohydrate ABC transporter permease [Halobacillus sp. Marseille-Q1614]|uniref:carbohydrate ABC transporter permease n=1 Tax=Halobacillus sp. Marseille-Q1614 TaxID=2709134 RepID=UPI0015703336|nr:carbohydrate ABC transporter permease [Halobacillus sp. Marseille-Q1614]
MKGLTKTVKYVLLTLLAFFFIFPLIWMVSSSLKPEESIYQDLNSFQALLPSFYLAEWLDSYIQLFERFDILNYLFNSVLYAAIVTIGSIVINGMAGYAFAKFSFFGKNLLFSLLLAMLIVPVETIIITQFTIIHNLGLVNSRLAVVLPLIANAFFIYLFRNFFIAVPNSVIESAKLEGAGNWSIFWRIMMPMSKPAIATVGTLSFIASWNDYIWPLMILTDGEKFPLQVAITNINSTEPVFTNQIMAILTISTIPLIIVYIVAQKYLLQGLGNTGTGSK